MNKQHISTPQHSSLAEVIANTNKLAEKTKKNEEELENKINNKSEYKTHYISADYVIPNIKDINLLVVDTTAGHVHVELPAAASSINKHVDVKKITNNTTFRVVLDSPDVLIENQDGVYRQDMSWDTALSSYTLLCTGKEWIII